MFFAGIKMQHSCHSYEYHLISGSIQFMKPGFFMVSMTFYGQSCLIMAECNDVQRRICFLNRISILKCTGTDHLQADFSTVYLSLTSFAQAYCLQKSNVTVILFHSESHLHFIMHIINSVLSHHSESFCIFCAFTS